MSLTPRSTLIPAEYPLSGDNVGDESEVSRRLGVTYIQRTVSVPSDRRLIMIPASIPIPLNSTIAAVLFAPLVGDKTAMESREPFNNTETTVAAHGAAPHNGEIFASLESINDQGTFIRLGTLQSLSDSRRQGEGSKSALANAKPGSTGHLPTVAEESPSLDNLDDDDAHSEDELNDDDVLATNSDVESEALTGETTTPQLPFQPLSTANFSPETFAQTSAAARPSAKRPHEELDAAELERPKKPRNSFFYFRRDYHKQINANGGRAKAKNISGLAGKTWNEMTEEEKDPYKKQAAEDTQRYKRETKQYKEALRRGKRVAKQLEKAVENTTGSGTESVADASRGRSKRRSVSTDCGMVLSRLKPVPMTANLSGQFSGTDILSGMAGLPVTIATDIEHTPSLFNEPMIISVDPNGMISTDMSTPHAYTTVAFGDNAMASGSMGPPLLPATSVQHCPSAYLHDAKHQFAHDQAGVLAHQHPYFQHQPHYEPTQHQWGDISSLFDNFGVPAVSRQLGSDSLLTAFSETGRPALSFMTTEQMSYANHRHESHIDHAMTVLSAHQLNIVTTAISAEAGVGGSEVANTPEHLTGIHPSIPDIEIVDASNSISLPTYSISRRR
ncbi:hypothetical protein GGI04_003255 [Coemansia thaxteri]|nr:hypothetical protein GGI04_003255 [Coemansia thaxteri]KAJ2470066.1 hypothetical protein GGI02_003175 [Coemansia sp. RSA 2322]KAJ2475798.1 hypothetical protein EV174_005147 [Coemansia sp. RSA 2320]